LSNRPRQTRPKCRKAPNSGTRGTSHGCPEGSVARVTRLTRRQVLIGLAGAGAIVVTGTGALAARGGGHGGLLHRTGQRAAPNNYVAPSGVTIASGEMPSIHMGRMVGWTISTPAVPARATVFCLHGYGNDHRFAFDEIHLPEVVASLHAPLAVAAVDGGSDSYWHARADGTDALAMFLEEFIPLVERRTKTVARALLGWSMGGYGSLLAAERAPERFFAIAAASPALWTTPSQTAPGAFDDATDYHPFDVFGGEQQLAGLTVRIDCGTGDPFYQATRRFAAALPSGHQGTFGPGSHQATYWRSVAPAQIATSVQALPPP